VTLSEAHRRYLIVEQSIGAAVFNFVLNGAIAWLTFRSLETIPVWGQQSIAGDTIGTAFLLPFITCLIVTRLAHAELRKGRLPALEWRRASHPWLARLPHSTWARGAILGLVCVVISVPVSLWALSVLAADGMGFWAFIAFKATFAAVLAAIFTPVIALAALADGVPQRAPVGAAR